jgi:hypothetical protein
MLKAKQSPLLSGVPLAAIALACAKQAIRISVDLDFARCVRSKCSILKLLRATLSSRRGNATLIDAIALAKVRHW